MKTKTVEVRRVIDGDTLAVWDGEELERIRLAHIDAPENGQPFCREARVFLQEQIAGRPVIIAWNETDRYGRKICEVMNHIQVNINIMMIKTGNAWAKEYRGKREDLKEIEEQARREGKGLFAELNPIRPWQYRKRITR